MASARLGVVQACRRTVVVKQRAAGTCFSLVFLFGVGESKPVPATAPGIAGPGSAVLHVCVWLPAAARSCAFMYIPPAVAVSFL